MVELPRIIVPDRQPLNYFDADLRTVRRRDRSALLERHFPTGTRPSSRYLRLDWNLSKNQKKRLESLSAMILKISAKYSGVKACDTRLERDCHERLREPVKRRGVARNRFPTRYA